MLKLVLPFLLVGFAAACTWQKEDDLYPAQPGCVPAEVTYQEHVRPIFETNCALPGCHASGSAYVSLEGYQSARAATEFSTVIGRITTTDPGLRMPPPPAAPLDACQIDIVKSWRDNGFKQN